MVDEKKLLREYIETLIESEYGGFDVTGAMADSPYGASFGSGKDLYNVFVKPFTDVVDTTVGKTKELSQRAQTLGKVAFEAMATSFIPTLADDFEEIFANEREQLGKLKAQYKDIYDATWTAFKDNDVVTAAFMFSPAGMITAKVAQQAPIQTVKLLNVLTGGRLDNFLTKVTKAFKLGDTKKPLDRDSGEGLPEGIIRKINEEKSVGNILTQKKILQTINDNPVVDRMHKDVKTIVQNGANQALERVNAIVKSKSVEELERKLGMKFKGSDDLKKLDQKDRAALEQHLLAGLKKSALAMYAQGFKQQASHAIKAGVPEDHPYVNLLVSVAQKIENAA